MMRTAVIKPDTGRFGRIGFHLDSRSGEETPFMLAIVFGMVAVFGEVLVLSIQLNQHTNYHHWVHPLVGIAIEAALLLIVGLLLTLLICGRRGSGEISISAGMLLDKRDATYNEVPRPIQEMLDPLMEESNRLVLLDPSYTQHYDGSRDPLQQCVAAIETIADDWRSAEKKRLSDLATNGLNPTEYAEILVRAMKTARGE